MRRLAERLDYQLAISKNIGQIRCAGLLVITLTIFFLVVMCIHASPTPCVAQLQHNHYVYQPSIHKTIPNYAVSECTSVILDNIDANIKAWKREMLARNIWDKIVETYY